MRNFRGIGCSIGIILVTCSCTPQGRVLENHAHLEFLELKPSGKSSIGFQVENGEFVGVEQFPSVYRLANGRPCTASQIGPRVVILAAHCFGDDPGARQTISISLQDEGAVVGDCNISDHYPEYDTSDVALCLLSKVVERPFYESLDIDSKVANGDELMFGGFGCWKDENGVWFHDSEKLAIGRGQAVSKPNSLNSSTEFIYTVSDNQEGAGVLCEGDSGGPTFFATPTFSEHRVIVAINAQVFSESGTSAFARLSSPMNASFIMNWIDERVSVEDIEICGMDIEIGCA